jgi:hypothetical protein
MYCDQNLITSFAIMLYISATLNIEFAIKIVTSIA